MLSNLANNYDQWLEDVLKEEVNIPVVDFLFLSPVAEVSRVEINIFRFPAWKMAELPPPVRVSPLIKVSLVENIS